MPSVPGSVALADQQRIAVEHCMPAVLAVSRRKRLTSAIKS